MRGERLERSVRRRASESDEDLLESRVTDAVVLQLQSPAHDVHAIKDLGPRDARVRETVGAGGLVTIRQSCAWKEGEDLSCDEGLVLRLPLVHRQQLDADREPLTEAGPQLLRGSEAAHPSVHHDADA